MAYSTTAAEWEQVHGRSSQGGLLANLGPARLTKKLIKNRSSQVDLPVPAAGCQQSCGSLSVRLHAMLPRHVRQLLHSLPCFSLLPQETDFLCGFSQYLPCIVRLSSLQEDMAAEKLTGQDGRGYAKATHLRCMAFKSTPLSATPDMQHSSPCPL